MTQIAKEESEIQPLKILIADNEYLIRWSLSQALLQEGYEVVAVENGKQAVEAARQQRFDFIITDLGMPELNGLDILKFAKQIEPQPKVIIMTAHGQSITERVARDHGAWAYLEKPYLINEIKGILKEVIPHPDPNPKE